jgi:hypothetical protein
MTSPRRAGRRRRASALVLAWTLGLYVFPLVHNVGHRLDHTHGPGHGPSVQTARPGHGHGHEHGPVDGHGHVHEPGHAAGRHIRLPRGSGSGTDPDHGRASVLHFAAAMATGQTPIAPGPGGDPTAAPRRVEPAVRFHPVRLSPARGPPPAGS